MHGVASLEEWRLLKALRAGEEEAFARLHERYNTRLVALAQSLGCTRTVAEEVTQETWAAVARNIHHFEGRSALKTWIYRILVNAAGAHARRETRSVPFVVTGDNVIELDQVRREHERASRPEERLLQKEAVEQVQAAIATLPPRQRDVITLCDVEGWSPDDVCGRLGISRQNQRVLLHRARTHVRRALADYVQAA